MSGIIFTGKQDIWFNRNSGAYRIRTIAKKLGEEIEVVDFFPFWQPAQLSELMFSRKVDWVGFSLTWMQYYDEKVRSLLLVFIQYLRKEYPNLKILGGGQNILASMFSKHFDYLVVGYGESAFIDLLKYLRGNAKKPAGLLHNNCWVIGGNSYEESWKDRDLSVQYVKEDYIEDYETLGIEFSRGCKFKCSFCNYPMLGVKEDNSRDQENIYTELQTNYDMFGTTNYMVADETINDREEKLIKIGNAVKQLNFNPNFSGYIRADLLSRKRHQLEMLRDSRIWAQFYGIESLNHQSAKAVGKGAPTEEIKEILLATKDYFMSELGLYRGTISLIFGLPYETKETIEEGKQWLVENWKGQHVATHPLLLDEGEEVEPYFNKSKLFFEKNKYGYKTFKCDSETAKKAETDFICWENEHMTAMDAQRITEQFPNEHFGYGAWDVLCLGEKDPHVAINIDLKTEYNYNKLLSHRQNYITKKLSRNIYER